MVQVSRGPLGGSKAFPRPLAVSLEGQQQRKSPEPSPPQAPWGPPCPAPSLTLLCLPLLAQETPLPTLAPGTAADQAGHNRAALQRPHASLWLGWGEAPPLLLPAWMLQPPPQTAFCSFARGRGSWGHKANPATGLCRAGAMARQ